MDAAADGTISWVIIEFTMLRHPSLIPLSHQHQHALALCVSVDRALAGDPREENQQAQAVRIAREFDGEIRDHFRVEELVLFPALRHQAELEPLIHELIGEHRQLEGLLAQPSAFTALLRRHVRREEGELFERAQQLLSAEEISALGEAIKRELNPPSCRR